MCSWIWSWISKRITRITPWLSFSSRYNKNQKRNAVEYQLKIADLCNIPIGKVKKLVPNFFDKEN